MPRLSMYLFGVNNYYLFVALTTVSEDTLAQTRQLIPESLVLGSQCFVIPFPLF